MQKRLFKFAVMIIAIGVFCGLRLDFNSSRELSLDLTVSAMAQEADAADAADVAVEAPSTFMDYWKQGGPTMWALLAVAIWATSVLIELLMKMRTKVFMPPDTVSQISDALSVSDYQKAWKIGVDNPSPVSRVFCAAAEKLSKGRDSVEEAVSEAMSRENSVYTIKNSYISLCAAIAPLLGLFGTISGMIGAFNAMAYGGAVGDPTRLAGDIGEALLTTYSGLLVAIPCMVLFYVLGNKLRKMIGFMHTSVMNLVDMVDFDAQPSDLVVATREFKAGAAKADVAKKSGSKQPGAITGKVADVGAQAGGEVVACPNCNKEIQVGVKACPHCNVEMDWE